MVAQASNRLLLGVLAVMALGLIALLPVLLGAGDERASTAPSATVASSSSPPEAALAEPAPRSRPGATGAVTAAPRSEVPVGAARLLVLRRSDRAPVAGVSVFAGDVRVGGPSDDTGMVEFERQSGQTLAIWGAGWLPVFVRGFEKAPHTALLDEAAARLEVRLLGMDPGDAVVRSQLQPHLFHVTGDSPWAPTLVARSRDRLAGERLPVGDYDVYVWVARGQEPARCLASTAVRVEGAEPVVLELDAAAPPAHEPDR